MKMRIVSTREERERLIEFLTTMEQNFLSISRKEAASLKYAEVVIEYVFKTDHVENENRVSKLLEMIKEAGLSDIKGCHHLYYAVRYSPDHEIIMDELVGISKGVQEIIGSETFFDWHITGIPDDNLERDLELFVVAAKLV